MCTVLLCSTKNRLYEHANINYFYQESIVFTLSLDLNTQTLKFHFSYTAIFLRIEPLFISFVLINVHNEPKEKQDFELPCYLSVRYRDHQEPSGRAKNQPYQLGPGTRQLQFHSYLFRGLSSFLSLFGTSKASYCATLSAN